MESEIRTSPQKHGKKRIILISLMVLILLMLAASAQFAYMTLNSNRVYRGIYINNMNAGGMTKTELLDNLKSQFQDKLASREIILKTDSVSLKSSLSGLGAGYDIQTAADRAYAIGRTGTIFDRIYDIIRAGSKNFTINMSVSYDKDSLKNFIDDFYNKTLVTVTQPKVLVREDSVDIHSGSHGESVDKNSIMTQAANMITDSMGGTITVKPLIIPPDQLNADNLAREIDREPKDAYFIDDTSGNITVEPSVTGLNVDGAMLSETIAELNKVEDTEKVIPVQTLEPKITTEYANAMLFKDTLGKMTTYFSTSNENNQHRGINIGLASSKIDGTILMPGQEFSFNGIVGKRTVEGGYQIAHTYVAGKVIDGIGGGICQVSTTLYNAVLKADLEVLERRNHMFTVGYVPLGQDATVSYGTTDFKFKNSTNWPIKITADIKKNSIGFTLTGTNETPDKKVIITNKTLKKTPFETVYKDDPTLAEGKTKVVQNGENGFVVDTFKTVKIGNKVVSSAKLYTSTYRPLNEQVLRGILLPDGTLSTSPDNQETEDKPAAPGIDDADNPPAPDTSDGQTVQPPAGTDNSSDNPAVTPDQTAPPASNSDESDNTNTPGDTGTSANPGDSGTSDGASNTQVTQTGTDNTGNPDSGTVDQTAQPGSGEPVSSPDTDTQ